MPESIMCDRFCVHTVVQARDVDMVIKAMFLQKGTRAKLIQKAFSILKTRHRTDEFE